MRYLSISSLAEEGVSHDQQIGKRVLIRRGAIPHLMQLAQARIPAGQATTPHVHADMTEVYWVESGQGILRIDGHDHALEAGICVVVEPGERHMLVGTGPDPLVVNYFGISPQAGTSWEAAGFLA